MLKLRPIVLVFGLVVAALVSHAAVTGQLLQAALREWGVALGVSEPPAPLLPQAGPGLGNLSYRSDELFKPVSWIRRDDNGVPPTYPGRKDYGLNVGIMHRGYFLTVFAPDSGWGPGGFLLYDISNPRNLRLVKRIYEPEGRTSEFREAHSMGTSTINGRDYIAIATTRGVEFWDFTDINDIRQVKKLVLPTANAGDYADVSWQLWWQAPYLYVASANHGVYIVDARDPANAVIANRGSGKPNPVPIGELGGFRVGPIFAMGNTMVLTSMDNTDGFASLDISDPLNPKVLDSVGSNPNYYATCFDGRHLYASARGGGARMFGFDLNDRTHFVRNDDRLVIDEQLYCGTQDNYVFQGAQHRMHKVDVSNPMQHVEVGQGGLFPPGSSDEEHSDHGQVAPFGNLVFIGNDHGSGSGFMVHSMSPDTTKPMVKQVSPAAGARQQALTSRIGLGMSDSILPESVNSGTFIVRPVGGNTLPGFYSVQLGLVNFAPREPLQPDTTYEIYLPAGGLRDYAGNPIAADYRATFTTGNSLDISLAHHWSLASTLDDPIGQDDGAPSSNDLFESIGLNFSPRLGGVALKDDSVASVLSGTASVSLYLKTTQAGNGVPWSAPGIFGRDQTGGADDVFWGWIDAGGRFNLSVGDVSNSNPGTRSTNPINDGQWHHVVMTRDAASGAQAMYVDGVKTSSVGLTGALGLKNRFQTLGQIQGNSDFFRGTLADVRVFGRVLGDADVAALRSLPVVGDPGLGDGPALVDGKVVFNPTVLGGSAQYSWNFGDGSRSAFSSQPRSTHTYTKPGHYSVTLTVRNSNGQETYYTFQLTVIAPVTAVAPTHTSNITGDANTIYSVNPDSGTVTAIDAQSLAKRWETRVGSEPRTLAVGPDGRIWVTVQDEDKLVSLLAADGSVSTTVSLPYGSGPHGVVFTPDRTRGLVTLESKSTLQGFDPASGALTGSVVLKGSVRGIAVASDSQSAYVTRFKSSSSGGQLFKVNLLDMSNATTVSLRVDTTTIDDESRARGVPNYLHQVVISPDGKRAILPSKKDNIVRGRFRDGQNLEHDRTVRSILSQVDLVAAKEVFNEQLDFDDRAPARAAVFAPNGDYIFVAQMEGNRVAIVDTYTRAVRGEVTDVGRAPHGLYLDAARKRLYVNNFLTRTVSVHDVSGVLSGESGAAGFIGSATAVSQETLGSAELRGKQVFYNAGDRRMSRDNYMSCASCHADGGDDGMVWDFTQRGEGLRRTINLMGRQGTGHGRVHWTANFDEIQDFENDVRNAFGGTGFMSNADFQATADPLGTPKAGRSTDLDDLAAYVSSLARQARSPARNADGTMTAKALLGKQVFDTAQCITCHSGTTLRDGLRHDVGTIQPSSGLGNGQPLPGVGFDTPTLFGTWSAPNYFHNGQVASLEKLFAFGHGNSGALSKSDQQALAAYVRSIDANSALQRIRSNQSNLCVNISKRSNQSGAKAIQFRCGSDDNEVFSLNSIDGYLQFVARHSGLCLAEGPVTTSPERSVVQVACNSGAATQWAVSGATLRSRSTGACLDVPGSSNQEEVELITYPCNGGNNQNWTRENAGR
ncbi:LamG-like jellyroll fold domain-containing protein [Ideonella sp. DXS29W]|uniref:LamG-like jellyroll fold domain-containing protein n=1 Tax=Ideonella lacteola TaxID=2984193 RepID=A0ABU9BJU0_9BURK